MEEEKTGALITAAGLSSRMGSFKPMLDIGGLSMAERIVNTFHKAGCDPVVMITGYRAEELEALLSGKGVIFLRNSRCAETGMFDSACIGLRYLYGKCGRILFTPADVPLFEEDTAARLLKTEAPLAVPVCEGKPGHPVLISSSLIPGILSYSGKDGMRGALSAYECVYVETDDAGILRDADTPEEYEILKRMHEKRRHP